MARSASFDISLQVLTAAAGSLADAVTLKPFAAAFCGETVFFTMPPQSAVGLQF